MTDKKNGNQFPKELWKKSDNIVFETIIKNIENKKNKYYIQLLLIIVNI